MALEMRPLRKKCFILGKNVYYDETMYIFNNIHWMYLKKTFFPKNINRNIIKYIVT